MNARRKSLNMDSELSRKGHLPPGTTPQWDAPKPTTVTVSSWPTSVVGAGRQFVRAPRTGLRLLYLPLEFDGPDGLTAVRCRYDET